MKKTEKVTFVIVHQDTIQILKEIVINVVSDVTHVQDLLISVLIVTEKLEHH